MTKEALLDEAARARRLAQQTGPDLARRLEEIAQDCEREAASQPEGPENRAA